jgi:hypothetical protein
MSRSATLAEGSNGFDGEQAPTRYPFEFVLSRSENSRVIQVLTQMQFNIAAN